MSLTTGSSRSVLQLPLSVCVHEYSTFVIENVFVIPVFQNILFTSLILLLMFIGLVLTLFLGEL